MWFWCHEYGLFWLLVRFKLGVYSGMAVMEGKWRCWKEEPPYFLASSCTHLFSSDVLQVQGPCLFIFGSFIWSSVPAGTLRIHDGWMDEGCMDNWVIVRLVKLSRCRQESSKGKQWAVWKCDWWSHPPVNTMTSSFREPCGKAENHFHITAFWVPVSWLNWVDSWPWLLAHSP